MNAASAARIWGAVTVAMGAAMLTRPAGVSHLVARTRGAATPNPAVVRILGGRQLLQGAAVAAFPGRSWVLGGGSVVDALHCASMMGAAVVWPRYRRPALASAMIAGSSAAAGLLINRRSR